MKKVIIAAVLVAVGIVSYQVHRSMRAEGPPLAVAQAADGTAADAATVANVEASRPGSAAIVSNHSTARIMDDPLTPLLDDPSSDERLAAASWLTWHFIELNTRERKAWCAAHGVDLAQFASAFSMAHSAESRRAVANLATLRHTDLEEQYPFDQPRLAQIVDEEMQQIAKASSPDQACHLFNDHAAEISETLALPSQVLQTLVPPGGP